MILKKIQQTFMVPGQCNIKNITFTLLIIKSAPIGGQPFLRMDTNGMEIWDVNLFKDPLIGRQY